MNKIHFIIQILSSLIYISHASSIACKQYYTIKNGDNCQNIAIRHNISVEKLKIINPLIDCDSLEDETSLCIKADLKYLDYIDISLDGTCGEGHGQCPKGQCCNKYGYCGTGKNFCGQGCQSEFGTCDGKKKVKMVDTERFYNNIQEKNDKVNEALNELMSKDEAELFNQYADASIEDIENTIINMNGFNEEDMNFDNFNIENCKDNCFKSYVKFKRVINDQNNPFNIETYNKVLKASGQMTIDEDYFLNDCLSQCLYYNEMKDVYKNDNVKYYINQYKKKRNEEIENHNLMKREKFDCSKKDKEITVLENKKDGSIVYKKSDYSALLGSRVDGCSAGIFKDFITVFTPACNGHDACYHCSDDKSKCDINFKDNMDNLCDKVYSSLRLERVTCHLKANIAYAAVSVGKFAFDGWNGDRSYVKNNKEKDLSNNYFGSYCICDKYDIDHFVSKSYTFE
ncbi:hypothetical protein BCR32DRAFT_289083 [Anaeromyces robustus]|uniref:Chitin-binding type-1 domain-containing protein n=1 Tax=Anaeromyces robustus TaxID=1754192 RepID=A0A1Y1XR32_9FUNG|nr:hypothetical protein BCR32DRAFT_289083 [Anaeromyces robustus]|eukprot:ORX87774.1 hypothetical protein BCR32DRAFT_289083 [Anaeromyces robustus]